MGKQPVPPYTVQEICDCDSFFATNGDSAPLFTAPVLVDNKIKTISLEEQLGKWVVLFFYPSDFTFVWPTELAAVAAIQHEFKEMNTELIAISTDSEFTHKVFFESSQKLKNARYPVVSDRKQLISNAYRVIDENTGASHRATIIINPEGNIVSKTIYPGDVGRNIEELLRLIKALRYSTQHKQATPANWKPGDEGIKRDERRIGRT